MRNYFHGLLILIGVFNRCSFLSSNQGSCDVDNGWFLCHDGECIPEEWRCDGAGDCEDDSDETDCHVKTSTRSRRSTDGTSHVEEHYLPCPPNYERCPNEASCIPLAKFCDNQTDCLKAGDESKCNTSVATARQTCDTLSCDFNCTLTKDGPRCYCPEGKGPNSSTCSYFNECLYKEFYCDQLCTKPDNQSLPYSCDCTDGFILAADNRTCTAINTPKREDTSLLVADFDQLLQLQLSGKPYKPQLNPKGEYITSVDFNHRNQTICWVSYNRTLKTSILRCNKLGDNPESWVVEMSATFLETVNFLVQDWITSNWYFVDSFYRRILVCNSQGKYCRRVVKFGEESKPLALAVDPNYGYMFYTIHDSQVVFGIGAGSHGKIIRASLDGTDEIDLVTEKTISPHAITLDFANKHLYWVDTALHIIERIDYDGNNRAIIRFLHQFPGKELGISVFENYLYVTTQSKRLIKVPRYNYSEPVTKLDVALHDPYQIQVYHRQRQPIAAGIADICTQKNCKHLCVLVPNNTSVEAVCLCEQGNTANDSSCTYSKECTKECSDILCQERKEEECLLDKQCSEDYIRCPHDGCIPSLWFCDNDGDCDDDFDEKQCDAANCDHLTEFQCQSGGCISLDFRCDGIPNCNVTNGVLDLSDEENCQNFCDKMTEFDCNNTYPRCLPKLFRCDGEKDCTNGADEENCDTDMPIFKVCDKSKEFQCTDGTCIPSVWKCDGENDCLDGSDEGCSDVNCKDEEFLCDKKRCIPKLWQCDRDHDCMDKTDEKDCDYDKLNCTYPSLWCLDKCVSPHKFCDGKNDCVNKADENGCVQVLANCSILKDKQCHNDTFCYLAPKVMGRTHVCDCKPGFTLGPDNVTCQAENVCKKWGVCSQICQERSINSTYKIHQCSCQDGYKLEADKFSCKPMDNVPIYAIFSNRHEMRRVNLLDYNYRSLVSGLRNTIALDFHYNKSTIYWTDVVDDKIYSGFMTSNSLTRIEPLIDVGLATTEGLAIDWIGDNIYWVESNLDQIEVAHLNNLTMRTTLVAGNMYSPRAIVLDPRRGMLFWSDWESNNPRIESSSMSGEGRRVIFNISDIVGAGWPNGLAMDYDHDRLYWIDARSDSIHTIKYDGSSHRTILRDNEKIRHPFAITLFGNDVYWTDWGNNALLRANKFNGSNVTVIQQTVTQPFDLQVYHPKRQPYIANPCGKNNGGCSHLCLINFNQTSGCKCPHLWKLQKDGKTCEKDMNFLLFGKTNEIRGVDLINANYSVMPTITVPHVSRPIAVDFDVVPSMKDSKDGRIFWADEGLKVINSALIDGSSVDTIIDSGIVNLGGFAVDWLSKNMYFSSHDESSKKGSISVCNLNGAYRVEILGKKDVQKPGSIALDPIKGYMYWCDMGGAPGQHQINRAKMDGTEKEVLYNTSTNPRSLNVDSENDVLYWIEGNNDTIIMSFDLTKRSNASIAIGNIRPVAITVFQSTTLYVAYDKYLASMGTNGQNLTILRDETTEVKYLQVYDIRSRTGMNGCSTGNGGCSQLCLPSGKLRVCRCTAGFKLVDSKTCKGINTFLIYTSATEIRGKSFDPSDKSEALPLISRINKAGAVDFHAVSDYIYWVDKSSIFMTEISRIKRDLTNRETIVTEETSYVSSIAIDWVTGNLYWTDAHQKIIEVVQVNNSSMRYVVVYEDLDQPTSIVVDPLKGRMYWIDSGRYPKVEGAALDGSGRHILAKREENVNKASIIGLALSSEDSKLYWCDNKQEVISMITLVEPYKEEILLNLSAVAGRDPIHWDCQSVTVHGDYIYWVDLGLHKGVIRAVHKSGQNVTTGWTDLSSSLSNIKAFDGAIQSGTNACSDKNGGCEQLCFFTGKNVSCACSYGKLQSDGKHCADHETFLVYSKVTSINTLHIYPDMNAPKKQIRNSAHIRNVIGLAVDYPNKRIFFSDIQMSTIKAVDFDGKIFTPIVGSVGSAEGIAYDEVSKYLYWTSYAHSTISRKLINSTGSMVNVSAETVVTLSNNDHPRAIVLDACSQRMFWTNWNDFNPMIQRSYMSGYNATSIITSDIRTPNGLTIDHRDQLLYWSDARLDKIERCDFDGNNRRVVVVTIPKHSFGLAVYGENLFWTDWMRRSVFRANKYDGNIYTTLRTGLQRQPMGIAVVAEDANDCTTNPCYKNPLRCEGSCKVAPLNTPFCSCDPPLILAADGVRCIKKELQCKVNDFVCHDGLKCFSMNHVCNNISDCLDGSDELPQVCMKASCGVGFFTCDNHQCVQKPNAECDGVTDCIDNSDEKSCSCPKDHFKCETTDQCIEKDFRCDFDPDCRDHSDEKGCNINCTLLKDKMFPGVTEEVISCNTTSQCILKSWLCDGKRDCFDSNDEKNCAEGPSNCTGSGFQCKAGGCIPLPWQCDGDIDCTDGSDEGDNCEYTCQPKMFNCSDNHCLPQSWQCDGYPDCTNGTDELDSICRNRTCKDTEFLCSENGRCIPMEWKCDGDPDCPDSEDESLEHGCQPPECSEEEFQCMNRKCVKKIFFCDGEDDCSDGSDEPSTCEHHDCTPGYFQCGALCLRPELKCDGHPDCLDGSDERDCNLCDVEGGKSFLCSNDVCINYNLTCNGRDDCGDHSDEPENCNVNECQSSTNKCTQKCTDRNIGYICECQPGYKLREDKHSCEDINECSTIYPCSHFCINTIGSFHCKCAQGYQLEHNGTMCKTTDSFRPYLILANRYYIRNISFTGEQRIIAHKLKNAVAVDYDITKDYIYWSELTNNSSSINRMNVTSGEIKVLHNTTVKNPDGLAVDWVARNLYWCDKTTDTIEVSRLDGRYRKVIISGDLQEPRALEVFPAKGLLFYTDWGDSAHISRANMDGTNIQKIVTDNLAWPNALTIDYVTEKIFWGDANLHYIAFADLDGKNVHTVINSITILPHIFSMTTFMDFIFWTDWEEMKIMRAHKFSGLELQTVATTIHRPMDMHVYHPMRQASVLINPCMNNGGCSHLCLLRPSPHDNQTLSKVCACPDNHIVQPDGTCISNCTTSQYLCKSSSKCIPTWWRCDGERDCDDGSDEPPSCPHYFCNKKNMFQCQNATRSTDCIQPSQLCNGINDCADKSDESSCDEFVCLPGFIKCSTTGTCVPLHELCLEKNKNCNPQEFSKRCKHQQCEKSQYLCGSSNITDWTSVGDGNCIPYVWVCDGNADCSDGSDEPPHCKEIVCRDSYKKCKEKGRCIPSSWWCDGDIDCGDSDQSDEDHTECAQKQCPADHLKCDNHNCIPARWKCDIDNDCKDGSDEKNCTDSDYRPCSNSEFRCDNHRCIPQIMKCDGEYNCEDSSDERGCAKVTCNTTIEFSCQSMCIPLSWKCDEDIDCPGGEDERSCQAQNHNCSVREFQCKNKKCIPWPWQCDRDPDCDDGSDEEPAHCKNYTCPPGMYSCKNHMCVYNRMRCDGKDDCGDGSDEENCYLDHICSNRDFRCQKDKACIPMHKVCDNKIDCHGKEDEDVKLCGNSQKNKCGPNNCQHWCVHYPSIRNYKCMCKPGYKLAANGYSCVFEDGCKKWGTCSQSCENLHPSIGIQRIHCRCDTGYILDILSSSVTTCSAIGYKPELLIAHENNMIQYSIQKGSNGGWENVISQNGNIDKKIESLDGHMVQPDGTWQIFTIQKAPGVSGQRSIWSTMVNSNQTRRKRSATSAIISSLADPTGIAIDWVGKHLYWADAHTNKIEMSKLDGSMRRTVIHWEIDDPTAIIVDPKNGKLYWTDSGYPPKICSSNLDGSGQKDLVKSDILWPSGLAMDYPNERLYWTDMKKRTVETIDLHGRDRHVVRTFNISDPPNKIDVFEDFLYISLYKTNSIIKIHKFNNPDIRDQVLLKNISYVGDVVILHPSKHSQNISNYCNVKKTEESGNDLCPKALCINMPPKGYKCVCPDDAIHNGQGCEFTAPCENLKCENGGNCSKNSNGKSKCMCAPRYTGETCQTDRCKSFCHNNGECIVHGVNLTCKCQPEYTGPTCLEYQCTAYCMNGGLCQVIQGRPNCTCIEAYTGNRCEICKCKNEGKCRSNRFNEITCECPAGWKGDTCEERTGECLCKNGGTCQWNNNNLHQNSHVCICKPGFTGDQCQTNLCTGYCLHQGNCSYDPKTQSKSCSCTKYHTGSRCQNCTCVHGRCSQTENKCKCYPGYSGELCNTTHCKCQNGGTCDGSECVKSEVTNITSCSPKCKCPPEYMGTLCEKQLKVNAHTRINDNKPTILLATIIPAVLLIIILIIVVAIICVRRNRDPFKHRQLNNANVNEMANPVYLQVDASATDEDDGEVDPLNEGHFEEHDDTNFANPMFNIYKAESTQVLLPNGNKEDHSGVEENGNVNKPRKEKKSKSKGKKKNFL